VVRGVEAELEPGDVRGIQRRPGLGGYGGHGPGQLDVEGGHPVLVVGGQPDVNVGVAQGQVGMVVQLLGRRADGGAWGTWFG
jgi:hypothetical protein